MKKLVSILFIFSVGITAGCSAPPAEIHHPMIPSLAYTTELKQQLVGQGVPVQQHGFKSGYPAATIDQPVQTAPAHWQEAANTDPRAQLHYVKNLPPEERNSELVSNEISPAAPFGVDPSVQVHRSEQPHVRDYVRPLTLGNPGVTSSLWNESRSRNDLFRDFRAYQPMDLVTIVVSESSEGTKEADTSSETESDILLGISSFFGLENNLNTSTFDTSDLVNATSTNNFEGEGETTRRGDLRARISAMVVEVLPNGILRVEGEKIIAVNNEEQVIVISGLVRPRDVSEANEVDSAKIANMRIDYYGRGVVGEAQFGGWFGRVFKKFWPF